MHNHYLNTNTVALIANN